MNSVSSNAVYKGLHKIVARTQLPIESTQGEEFVGENVYDVEYEGGLHHVSGLFVLKSTVDFTRRIFTLAKRPSQVSVGNCMWFSIVVTNGQAIMGRVTGDGEVFLWGGVVLAADSNCNLDFWYKDNSVTQ